ncbi:MAG: Fe-S cluster assembly protein SufD [Chthoniobacterales bacterium]
MSKALMEAPEAITTEKPVKGIVEEYAVSTSWPEWFQKDQHNAWEEFQSLAWPTRKDETWRFSNTKMLKLDGYIPAAALEDTASLIGKSVSGLDFAARFVFINNRFVHQDGTALPEGVIVEPLSSAAEKHPDLFRKYFMKQAVHLGSRKLAALHKAHLLGGMLVYVPNDVVLEKPIEIYHWVSGENAAIFPHTLVVLGRNSRATVIDHYYSADGAPAFAAGVNDLHLHEGADLTYLSVQEWSKSSLGIHLNSTIVERNASARALQVNLGGRFIRTESLSRMVGDGARSDMLSISPVSGEQELDQRTLQDHAHPNTASDLLYHNSLDDKSRTVFSGLIRVESHAHRTDAYQKVRNLLLSDEAEANSMPGLEINADDVRCTHGATSGQVNENELFYMQARGISPKDAQQLIVAGFLCSVIERLPQVNLREYLFRKIQTSLGVA